MSAWLHWLGAWVIPALAAIWTLAALLFAARGPWSRPSRPALAGGLALVALALYVRLSFVPALAGHRFDGHEAEYYDLFLGEQPLSEGTTTLYPAMQALWFALGQLLPRHPAVPTLVSVLFGLVGGALLARAVGLLSAPRAGWAAALLLALHPAHAAWSGSAYNVIAPSLLIGLATLAVARLVAEEGPAGRPGERAWIALAGGALALAVACRVEVGVTVAPLALLGLCRPGLALRLWPALGLGAVVGLGAVLPLLGGGTPGEGERLLAFSMNALWTAPLGRLGSLPGLLLLGVGAALATLRWRARSAALLVGTLLGHLTLACFSDLGERHTLALLSGLIWALAAGGVALGARGLLVPALAAALFATELVDLRGRYEGSESSFSALLARPPLDALPRYYVRRPPLPGRSPIDPRCAFVSEDERVASPPLLSHFNLWDPAEVEALRGEDGCLHWCLDAADWRWSSRGVRDRALRVAHLYALEPVAVVEEPTSGYACLVMDVGARRCCGPGLPVFAPGARVLIP